MSSEANIQPVYELWATGLKGGQMQLEIRQMPSSVTPRVKKPERVAGLKGRTLEIIEVRVMRCLKPAGIRFSRIEKGKKKVFPLDEDMALNMALMFRVLAPMRNIDRIRTVAKGIDEMSRDEAGYWLGMAMHRSNPRRVLAALRMLMTT